MFTGKKGPILLLFLLVIAVVFIVGMNYGKKVEEADKTIKYLLSITPSPHPTQLTQQIEYKEFVNELCGFSFLYPNNLHIQKEASSEAVLQNATESIQISCGIETQIANNVASSEAILDNKSGLLLTAGTVQEYRVRDVNNKLIIIKTTKELGPLIEKTFSFNN